VFARFLFKTISIAFGIALLLAALFFDGGTASSVNQQATPVNTLSPFERLAEPTLPAQPSQADQGAQDFWLYCLPCHGDKGQGLTDEFRTTYPPEEEYCWESGCHGENPYENGFALPKQVPAVIGQSTLAKFSDAAQLNSYVRATMPFWKPGSLTEEEAWRVTAFMLRENGLWDDVKELDESNASAVRIPRGALTPATTPQQAEVPNGSAGNGWVILAGVLLLFSVLLFVLKKSRNTTTI
jgi:cytochrome c